MIEIEYKFEISKKDIPVITKRLSSLGFSKKTRRIFEKTVMFDNESSLMQSTNGRIRVRQIGTEETEFSYKKPLLNATGPKKEIEYEVHINHKDSTEILTKILEEMHFSETTCYERYRTTFVHAKKEVKVTIDEYPFAIYLEIEAGGHEAKKTAIAMGFNLSQHLDKPCDTLFTEWRASRDLPMTDKMLFSNYDQ